MGVTTVSATPVKAFSKTRTSAPPEELWATVKVHFFFNFTTLEFCVKTLADVPALPAHFTSETCKASLHQVSGRF